MDLGSASYGLVMGVVIVLAAWWITGRQPFFRRSNVVNFAIGLGVYVVIFGLGLSFEAGLLVIVVGALIAYLWQRGRTQPT